MMNEISAASSEQTTGIQQINQAIGQIDDVTQQNAALVEQAAAAAESLEEQTQNLSGTLAQFKVVDHSNDMYRGIPKSKPVDTFHPASPQKDPVLTRAGAIKNKSAVPPTFIQPSSNDEWEEF
jgi:methyl-accepting chemotaxis protein